MIPSAHIERLEDPKYLVSKLSGSPASSTPGNGIRHSRRKNTSRPIVIKIFLVRSLSIFSATPGSLTGLSVSWLLHSGHWVIPSLYSAKVPVLSLPGHFGLVQNGIFKIAGPDQVESNTQPERSSKDLPPFMI